jgi:hypothetical protein
VAHKDTVYDRMGGEGEPVERFQFTHGGTSGKMARERKSRPKSFSSINEARRPKH